MRQEALQDFLQVQQLRLAVDERDHVHAERILELRRLYRLFSTTSGTSPRLSRSRHACRSCRTRRGCRNAFELLLVDEPAIRSSSERLFTWYGSSSTMIAIRWPRSISSKCVAARITTRPRPGCRTPASLVSRRSARAASACSPGTAARRLCDVAIRRRGDQPRSAWQHASRRGRAGAIAVAHAGDAVDDAGRREIRRRDDLDQLVDRRDGADGAGRVDDRSLSMSAQPTDPANFVNAAAALSPSIEPKLPCRSACSAAKSCAIRTIVS